MLPKSIEWDTLHTFSLFNCFFQPNLPIFISLEDELFGMVVGLQDLSQSVKELPIRPFYNVHLKSKRAKLSVPLYPYLKIAPWRVHCISLNPPKILLDFIFNTPEYTGGSDGDSISDSK